MKKTRVEIRNDYVLIDGYVNAVLRDSREMKDKRTGQRFVERINAGAFERALQKNEVQLLWNHEKLLGSTSTNLELYEDNIGLHARAKISDEAFIKKAREKKLTGWSFGFVEKNMQTEKISEVLERRLIIDMILLEVSIIDEMKVPCYSATSIEVRADEEVSVSTKFENETKYIDLCELENYKKRIKRLEK